MMSTASNVIQFPSTSSARQDTSTDREIESAPRLLVSDIQQSIDKTPATNISIDELYTVHEALTPRLSVALRLLAKALEDLDEALDALRHSRDIAADDAIQRVHALLPELFSCRALSDSFGEIINATLCALDNVNGIPLGEEQIKTIRNVLYRVRSEPFMQFGAAVEEVSKLETVGLNVEPAEFGYLADWLDE